MTPLRLGKYLLAKAIYKKGLSKLLLLFMNKLYLFHKEQNFFFFVGMPEFKFRLESIGICLK